MFQPTAKPRSKTKQQLREEAEMLTAEYLAKGGTITKCPTMHARGLRVSVEAR